MQEPAANPNFPELERQILEWWKQEKVFEQTIEQTKTGTPFIFYEGPPTANGKPHIGHVLGRSFKDLFPRFKTMQGYSVPRKAGWDSHGLPVELEVEKELGITGKKQIEEFGIEKFNQLCRESVFRHIEIWQNMTERMGFWLDFEHAYIVMNKEYIESLWWILEELWNNKLLRKDYKVAPYCPRCQTPISSHELAQGYQDNVPDPSLFVLFKTDAQALKIETDKPTYFLAWTTTPWTLLGNVGLAVAPEATYVAVETPHPHSGETAVVILAKERVDVLSGEYTIVKEYTGKDLVDVAYEPLFSFLEYEKPVHVVVPADFVALNDGSGIVHTAAMYGEDDFELAKQFGLPRKHVVTSEGTFIPEAGMFAGKSVLKSNDSVISTLTEQGSIYKSETIHHTYPFCWRCKSKLIYYALDSWFIAASDKRDVLLANNAQINWVPEHLKDGRMGDWLRNIKDWSLSRWRYWGTPLPIWRCTECGQEEIVGSYEQLKKRADQTVDIATLDPHRPYIDRITLTCNSCNGSMKRYEDVLDTWFDSGGMPYAQWHYPFENTAEFESQFPADFICEGLDQTRGWFYTLLSESSLLGRGVPAKNILCYEMVLDSNGRKMSKSVGNVMDPFELFDEFGADLLRWYFYSTSQIGKSYRMGKQELQEVKQRYFNILWNSYRFFVSNALMDGWQPSTNEVLASSNPLDKWILSRLDSIIKSTTGSLESFDAFTATRVISTFVVNDVSQWYIRRSRDRVGATASDQVDKNQFYQTAYVVFKTLSRLIAPMTPFTAEMIYRNLRMDSDPVSVHLSGWPVPISHADQELDDQMSLVRLAAEKIHAERKTAGIKVRQPLADATVTGHDVMELSEGLREVLQDEVNVRHVVFVPSEEADETTVTLNVTISEELKKEGQLREIIRKGQELRRQAQYAMNQPIKLSVTGSGMLESEHRKILGERLLASDVSSEPLAVYDVSGEVVLDGETLTLHLQKI